MSQENKALMQRWFDEVWTRGRATAIREMVTDDVIIHGLSDTSGMPVTGVAAFDAFHSQFRSAFPDITITVEDLIAEGDKVVARCSVRAKHTGDSLGFAPTHADVEFNGIAIARISDGRIAEAWNTFDFLTMNQQLGVV